MKPLVLIAFLVITTNLFAQNLYFANNNYTDSVALVKAMPILAKQVIQGYKEPRKDVFWDNVFRCHLVAKDYKKAIALLDSCKLFYKVEGDAIAALGFQFESFALTKEQQKTDARSFETLYPICFNNLYSKLPIKATLVAENYFDNNVAEMQTKLQQALTTYKTNNKDSISINDAIKLCRLFIAYQVYKQVKPLALPMLEAFTKNKYIIQDSVLLTMKDGGKITACIVQQKNITVPQPVVIKYDIYADNFAKLDARDIANEGYVGIIINTRGKKLSPQNIEPFEHDASDAYEIADWISKQAWCNGKIGIFGGSYLGFSQWAAAKNLHPAIKTIVPQVAVAPGIDYPNFNGIFMGYALRWIHFVSNNKLSDSDEFKNTAKWDSLFSKWYTSGAAFKSLDTLEGRPNPIFQRWLNHPSYDTYWQNMVAYKQDFSKITIPVLTTTGYFDSDQRGAFYYFNQHHLYNKNTNHYLLIGPYDHSGAQRTPKPFLQGYTIDSVANVSITNIVFKWFDYILKDSVKPAILKDKINYQVMGTNAWKHAPSLSNINTDTLTFYLSNLKSKAYYQLQNKKPITTEFIAQTINLADRTDVDAPNDFEDKLILDSVLKTFEFVAYATEPLQQSITINGSFFGQINTIINKKDMDLSVSLYEQMPNGQYFNLSNYITRASYTKNRSERVLLQPNKVENIAINNTYFVSKQLEKGSRIIVLVGVNKSKNWEVNYGTGKDVSTETIADAKVPLLVKWLNSSFIKLPVFK